MKNSWYIFTLLLLPFLAFGQWSQLGPAVQGEAMGDYFGYKTDLNALGDVMIVGARFNSGNGYYAGHARVLEWDGTNWNQLGADIDGTDPSDFSGHDVSIDGSGNRVAIGSVGGVNPSTGVESGIVKIFDWNGTTWNQVGNTIAGIGSVVTGSDWFGSALSFSANGNILAIGGPLNGTIGHNAGHARVYEWNGTNWMQLGNDISGANAIDQFGGSVSINESGTILAVGAKGTTTPSSSNLKGYAKVYEWNGTSWVQRGNKLIGDVDGDEFGRSVSLSASGDFLAVGAPGIEVITGNLECSTHTYAWNGTNYVPLGNKLVGDLDGDEFGWDVSLNAAGNILAIGGAPFSSKGAAWLYEWTGTAWVLQDKLEGGTLNDFFGSSLNLNAVGNVLAVGAWGNQDIGQVRVFENPMILNTQEMEDLGLRYFPNPATNDVFLSTTTKLEWVTVYDVAGKELRSQQGTSNEMTIDLSTLNAGTYLLEVQAQGQRKTVKLIKP